MSQDQSIVHEVTYPYPPERVWRALVDPDELAVWLKPNDFVPLVGRRFTMECEQFGRVEAEVVEIDPGRLSCRWVGSFGDTVVIFELTATTTGTRLRVEHRGWTTERAADRERFQSGWSGKLTIGLPRLLEGVPL